MFFSLCNLGIEWLLDFGPDSISLTAKDLVQELTIISQEFPLTAWSLLLSERQGFLNNYLERALITLNREGPMEMRNEVLTFQCRRTEHGHKRVWEV